jgi:hypothetical protein
MRLSAKTLATTFALLWGGGILFVGLLHLIFPSYGSEFLRVVSSIYPGYDATRSFGDVLVGTLYGLLDGAIAGWLLAWLYNIFASRTPREA